MPDNAYINIVFSSVLCKKQSCHCFISLFSGKGLFFQVAKKKQKKFNETPSNMAIVLIVPVLMYTFSFMGSIGTAKVAVLVCVY